MTTELLEDLRRRDDLGDLLVRAGGGDLDAFMEFYDATCPIAWRLACLKLGDRAAAEQEVLELYLAAWRRAGEHASSDRSSVAWLLTLPRQADPDCVRPDGPGAA